MASSPVGVTAMEQSTRSDPYLPIEEVARRLDLPLGILIRRAEAGDIPVRRVEAPDGALTFTVRLSDLGVDRDELEEGSGGEPAAVDVVGSARPWPEPEPELQPAAPSAAADARPAVVVPLPEPSPPVDLPRNGRGSLDTDSVAATLVPAIQRPDPRFPSSPHADVANMTLDPREVVAGLLDRWERTLEHRIYAEQRQRFESELNARQNLVKQLQLELQTVRAENAASLAERDRRLAESERTVAQLQQQLGEAREAASRRRGFFRH